MVDLHVKYRPESLDEIYGQDSAVNVLEGFFDSKNLPHAFLFSGKSGVGKTTLARIIGIEYLGSGNTSIVEIDAATHSKVEDMRELVKHLQYKPLMQDFRLVIIDECQSLSKQAWQSLLKPVEEPNDHTYFAFCTTEISKVLPTIKTRCIHFDLKSVSLDDLIDLVQYVADEESIGLDSRSISIIAEEAQGSPRQAIVNLSMCSSCNNADEVISTLDNVEYGETAAINLCRALVKPDKDRERQWNKCMEIVKQLDTKNYEGVRLVVVNYMTSVILNGKKGAYGSLDWYLLILDAFETPYNQSDGKAPLIVSLGRVLV